MKEKRFIVNNPHLPVKSLQQTLAFYKEVLGFYDEWTWTNEEGSINDGGICRDGMLLLFAEELKKLILFPIISAMKIEIIIGGKIPGKNT